MWVVLFDARILLGKQFRLFVVCVDNVFVNCRIIYTGKSNVATNTVFHGRYICSIYIFYIIFELNIQTLLDKYEKCMKENPGKEYI